MNWIKCSERIPSQLEDVLVYDEEYKRIVVSYLNINENKFMECSGNVRYWMELPEVPKDV